jgi:hypothetical protein
VIKVRDLPWIYHIGRHMDGLMSGGPNERVS